MKVSNRGAVLFFKCLIPECFRNKGEQGFDLYRIWYISGVQPGLFMLKAMMKCKHLSQKITNWWGSGIPIFLILSSRLKFKLKTTPINTIVLTIRCKNISSVWVLQFNDTDIRFEKGILKVFCFSKH